MDPAQHHYATLLYVVTLVNIVAGVIWITLATIVTKAMLAMTRAKEPAVENWQQRADRVERYHHETPTEVSSKPIVRRSSMLSAQGRRDFYG